MTIGVPLESSRDEGRVALVPSVLPPLTKAGLSVVIEQGAGGIAGFPDTAYVEHGARIAKDRTEVFSHSDLIARVRGLNTENDTQSLRPGQIVAGLLNPFSSPAAVGALASVGVTSFALEFLPRISRAQPMDALTSMATVAGYKAVLLAAGLLQKMFPMMMTAAGTIMPARVFVIGAGVAGLQAIATSRRLGAVVVGYDVRPSVREQIESLGAKFLEIGLETKETEGSGGYAKAMSEEFYHRQRDTMKQAVAECDVVITTAAIPGKKAPVLITHEMVQGMRPGSVIVDLAAETGGNCELTRAGETVELHGVRIVGPVNLPGTIPHHASQLYARNVTSFVLNLVKDGQLNLNMEDQIIRDTLLTHKGEVVSVQLRDVLGLPALREGAAS